MCIRPLGDALYGGHKLLGSVDRHAVEGADKVLGAPQLLEDSLHPLVRAQLPHELLLPHAVALNNAVNHRYPVLGRPGVNVVTCDAHVQGL